MAEVTYPYGYGSARKTMAELEATLTVKNCHKEFWRRLKALMIAGQGRCGVGTAWRSSDVQRNTFLSRHHVVASGGCCQYEGRRYQLTKGNAHAAPPGRSFHESTFHGYAQAVDAVGDLAWMHAQEAKYGLKDFRNVGNEPWHFQMTEIANSVSSWINQGRPHPQVFKLPGDSGGPPPVIPPKPPTTDWHVQVIASMPVLKIKAKGVPVARMQHFLLMAGRLKGPNDIDSQFGATSEAALNAFRKGYHLAENGTCDTTVWDLFMAAGDGIPTLSKGAFNDDVIRMQRMMSANGYFDKNNAANFDGRFGDGTQKALMKFQGDHKLGADGQCGPKTWTALLTA